MSDTLERDCLAIELRIAHRDLARTTEQLAQTQAELDIAGETLADTLTCIAFLKQTISAWKSAPVVERDALRAELHDVRAEMARYTRSRMS